METLKRVATFHGREAERYGRRGLPYHSAKHLRWAAAIGVAIDALRVTRKQKEESR